MKKLSNIEESVWGDIRRRGNGTDVKNEDKFNPEYIDFGENTSVYWAVDNLNIDGQTIFKFDEVKDYNNNGWRLPTVEEVKQLNWKGGKTYWDLRDYKHKVFAFPGGDKLRLKCSPTGNVPFMWTCEEADRDKIGLGDMVWRYGYDNTGDFGLSACHKDNKSPAFLVKDKSYVNESVWGDIRKRGNGNDVKQEDKGIDIVIDGVKYHLMKDFWGLGDVYEEENSDPWRCFAFNKPENNPTVIWGDTEIAGAFGCDKWDIGEDEYDVYVLREYIDKDRDDYIDELIDNGKFEQMYSTELEIQDILVKYTKKIFEDNHMSDFAKYTIYELIGTDYDFGGAIYYEEDGTWYDEDGNPTIPPCELEDVDYNTVQDIHIISYPMLDNWYEDLSKELIDAYTRLGWVHLKKFELDYENNPSGMDAVAFIKFKD